MLKIIQKISLILLITTTSVHAIDWQIARPVFDVSTILWDEEAKKTDFNDTYFKDDYVKYTFIKEGKNEILVLNLADHFWRSGYSWYNALENYFDVQYDVSDIKLTFLNLHYILTIVSGKRIFLYDESTFLWKLHPPFQMLTFIMRNQAANLDEEKTLSFTKILKQLEIKFPKFAGIRFWIGEDEKKQPIYATIPAELMYVLKSYFYRDEE